MKSLKRITQRIKYSVYKLARWVSLQGKTEIRVFFLSLSLKTHYAHCIMFFNNLETFADIVQRLECCPSKSEMRVQFPLSAPIPCGYQNIRYCGYNLMVECLSARQIVRVQFPLSAPIADIVQLAERTLGKGKVPSSILGFSTS